jgi:hypothetical protein
MAKIVSWIYDKDGNVVVTYDDKTTKLFTQMEAIKQKIISDPGTLGVKDKKVVSGSIEKEPERKMPGNPLGSYGVDPTNSFTQDPASGVTYDAANTVPMNIKGAVQQVPIGYLIKQVNDPVRYAEIKSDLVKYNQIGKGVKSQQAVQNAWTRVLASAAAVSMNPTDWMKAFVKAGGGQDTAAGTGDMSYVKTYTGSTGDALFRKAFQDVFDRLPTAADYASPIVDSNGKQVNWIDALNAEAQKKENRTTVKRSADGTLQTTNDPFDAATWLTNQLMSNYTKGIEAGTAAAPQKLVDQYAQLAQEYGIPVYDSTTKKLYMNAAKDVAALEAGTKTLEDVANLWKGNVKAQYSHLAPAVDSGLSLRQIADPGIKLVAKLTGKNESLVDLNNPYVQAYLKGDGKSTLAENVLRSKIISDPTSGFDKTPDAYALTDGLTTEILKRFGRMA